MTVRVVHPQGPLPEGQKAASSSAFGADLQVLEHLGRLLDVTHDLLCVIGPDGYFTFLNSSWEGMLGYSHEEMMATPFIEFVHPEDRAATLEDARKVLAGTPTTSFENRQRCKDGSYKWFSWAVTALLPQQLSYAAGRDITEQKRSEDRVLRLAQAVENSTQLITIGDGEGRIMFANQTLLRAAGYEEDELLEKHFSKALMSPNNPPDLNREIGASIVLEGGWRGECLYLRKDGTDFPVFLTIGVIKNNDGVLIGAFGTAEDVTERRKLERQLRQAQKMEAVGHLAGGIAHDFNNLLMVIMGYAGSLEEHLHQSDPLRKKAEEINKAGQRAASLTRQLLAFSRQQVLQPKVLKLNSIVVEVKEMLRRLISENIELTTALDPELGRVKVDQGQIEQVIVNLIVNARDAMPQGGRLLIRTENVQVDDAYARQHAPMSPGSFVMLSVTDTGIGMDAETQSHIFEPFFTTKERGKGTGLGLATVYGVVKQSGGFIWVYSEPGHGTTFKILLPRVDELEETVAQNVGPEQSWKGSETILLVEDEESVRKLILNLLTEEGYTVLEAADGNEAWNIAQQAPGKIHLLITDVVMPGMGGTQVADKITSLDSSIKVLFMSGYTEFDVGSHEILRRGQPLLQKPFTRQSLVRTVRETLETNPAPAAPSQQV